MKYLMLAALTMTLMTVTQASHVVAQCSPDQDAQAELYRKFLNENWSRPNRRKIAYETGKEYLAKYGNCPGERAQEITAYVRAWLKKYEGTVGAEAKPMDEAIRKIRSAKEWHNPYVMVYRDSFELILHDRPRTSERIGLAKLEKSLLDLPPERWPLGRVVAVQEIAIRSGRDDEKIARNVAALKRMLHAHKIRVDLWPTG